LNKIFYRGNSARGLHVLKDISLDIKEGDMIALMGPSGVGKSTLLHILGALDRPTSGSVIFRGIDVFSMNDEEMARFRSEHIGFVFQFHHLLPEFSAIENVMMPALIAGLDHREVRTRASEILNELGLKERLHHKPGELSGGEQQRVAIARALVLEPDIILADEPTGNLDSATGAEVFNLLYEINKKGVTIFVVTHNEDIASRCRNVLRMKDGRIIDSGKA